MTKLLRIVYLRSNTKGHWDQMKLSTKARYAVLALVDLAMNLQKVNGKSVPVSLLDIAGRQNLSQSYLEQLFNKLRHAGIVQSVRGSSGGYFINRPLKDLSIAHIVDAVDEPLKATNCSPDSELSCQGKHSKCLSHKLWTGLDIAIRDYLSAVTLADVVDQRTMPKPAMTSPQQTIGKIHYVA